MDFDRHKKIELRYYSDNLGPYSFDFARSLPTGDTISAVSVKAYLGNVTPDSVLADQTDISDEVIDPGYTPQVVDDTSVSLRLKYPTTDYKGESGTLVFELQTAAGMEHPYYFNGLEIK